MSETKLHFRGVGSDRRTLPAAPVAEMRLGNAARSKL